ncbi:molybdenum cofactor biosynthesis protein MoaE [Magnetovibrio sp. PR-2]|uniref:molybdenum cofactor biosynthesis protein MoaE n=1 Tax=Magnetovibrio sp. PR-2 TaxID=3120356 RepID=UPI002FCE364A
MDKRIRNLDNSVRVQAEPFDAGLELSEFVKSCSGAGGISTFVGVVRGHNDEGPIQSMTLEHYPGMTERELKRLLSEAQVRWSLNHVLIIHRFGRLMVDEPIVLVATASKHRKDAIKSCEFLIDCLKTTAPFWKLEDNGNDATWVDAKESDCEHSDTWRA